MDIKGVIIGGGIFSAALYLYFLFQKVWTDRQEHPKKYQLRKEDMCQN